MKIGLLLISHGFSGTEKVVHELLKYLSKNRALDINLFTNNEMICHYKDIRDINIKNIGGGFTKNHLLNRFILSKLTRNLYKRLKKEKFDLVSAQGESPIDIMGRLKNNNEVFILTFHGEDLVTFNNSFKKLREVIKERGIIYSLKLVYYRLQIHPNFLISLKNTKRIVIISHHQIKNLPKKYKQKTIVIPNGVDIKTFKPLKNIKQKNDVILFTGRFIELKGIKEILEVAKQLPQYEFWFAGQGPLRKEIQGRNIKNLGFQTTESLVKLYNQTTICIQPSHREGMPLVGLEAMSCGRVVIATPLGFSEYIENGKDGIIIPAKNLSALKTAILGLMTNPKKRKMIEKNARKKALKYSWDKIAKQYLKVFEEVVKENKK